ncbi:hypothetical protein [Nocardia otitidiscaviarum]|nr:hypothetical protein [Nocardia otitidiscaviarum]
MHDPDVVVADIRRPWPHITRTKRPHTRQIGWRCYWYLGSWELYFPSIVTIWHREPGGHDSGTVCKPSTWARHPHHWWIQVPPLQDLRRYLLTRCEWCGGNSRNADPVNVSSQWDRERGPWWRGESGLYHRDCLTVWHSHILCYCDTPDLDHGDYGTCRICGGRRAWRKTPTDLNRAMADLPVGARMPQWIKNEFAARRDSREAAQRE